MNTERLAPTPLSETHPSWVVLIHWVTVALVVLAAASVLSRELVSDKELRTALMIWHRGAGLMVLAVTLLRVAVSPWTMHRDEPLESRALRIAAAASHGLLYLVLLANPMLGWALTSAHGQVAYFLGVVALPALVGKDRDLADQLQEAHETVAVLLLVVVLLHSAAALWHHYVRRDAVLRRMLAIRKPAETSAD